MLLTGFDSPRLKKLYLGRKIKDHNLLQMLTRVNRPYNKFKYGYVVDFADIKEEFEKTNKAYFDELQEELGDEFTYYSNLFENRENIEKEILNIKNTLILYDLNNKENFSKQISQITNRKILIEIKNSLESSKNLYNLIRLYEHKDLINKLDFSKLNMLLNEVSMHLNLVNLQEALSKKEDNIGLMNLALENIDFFFTKISEKELVIADKLREKITQTRKGFEKNFDKKDPEYVFLYEELRRLFQKKKFEEMNSNEINKDINFYNNLHLKVNEINRKNDLINEKYNRDYKFTRVHKRIMENQNYSKNEILLFDILNDVKLEIDQQSLINSQILDNKNYFKKVTMPIIISKFNKLPASNVTINDAEYLNNLVANEYLDEFSQKILN
jgi:type I restriction enzyme R subunit